MFLRRRTRRPEASGRSRPAAVRSYSDGGRRAGADVGFRAAVRVSVGAGRVALQGPSGTEIRCPDRMLRRIAERLLPVAAGARPVLRPGLPDPRDGILSAEKAETSPESGGNFPLQSTEKRVSVRCRKNCPRAGHPSGRGRFFRFYPDRRKIVRPDARGGNPIKKMTDDAEDR